MTSLFQGYNSWQRTWMSCFPMCKSNQEVTYLLHGAESFLRSQRVFRLSRISQNFIEPEGSFPQSQVPATCPYPEPKYQSRSEPYSLSVSQHETFSLWGVVSTSPKPKPEDHPLSAVRDCLFNILATTLHTGGRSSNRNLRTRHAVVKGQTYHGEPGLTSNEITQIFHDNRLDHNRVQYSLVENPHR